MSKATPATALLPLPAFSPSSRKNDCIVTKLTNVLARTRIILPDRCTNTFSCRQSQSKGQLSCTLLANLYFLLVFIHAGYYVLEILFGYASVGRDQSINSLKNAIFNSRYGIMILRSTILLVFFRYRSKECMEIAGDVAVELKQCSHDARTLLCRIIIAMAIILFSFVIAWEVMDFAMWETDFTSTLAQQVEVGLFNQKIPLWNLLLSWYLLASPVNILMNLAMICLASIVLGLFAAWRLMNGWLIRDKHVYLLTKFEGDWERLRKLAERTDDVFSVTLFVALVGDIACAVGYVGSIVIYGAGRPLEQIYTTFGLFIHAVWYPAGYIVPCILFHEEITSKTMTHLNLIVSKISYRPEAFTGWKFFFITRNLVLTISTVLVSYALIMVQLIGRKQDVQGVVNLINEKMNASTGSSL
ncbi:uncharacterized protein LOC129598530 isoform X2 [Paramacrobiotus metropolitanus]|uniref:uncharacterized protein LOC129598530 isoform X2 n=1 Tax=Paramacrobiotus metropolitanus TaxID=2943436 RepID=UPI0024465C67|nr:uncharacterized protein LOC129598530 isoform X2 [Paramacrobiotus metropolitanus]